jgi:hypothetical protein
LRDLLRDPLRELGSGLCPFEPMLGLQPILFLFA